MITNEVIQLYVEKDDLKMDLLTLLTFLAYSLGYANQAFNSFEVLSKTEAWGMLEKYEHKPEFEHEN